MKVFNKIVSVICFFILIMNIIFPVFSFAKTNYYLATGDSIAYGYGLPNINSQSYAQIVRNKLGVSQSNFKNLAVSGMTCQEYYSAIQQSDFTNEIKKADLLTVSIGSNELLELATGALSNATGIAANDPAFLTKVKQVFIEASITQKYAMATQIYDFFTSQETKNKIEESIRTYEQYWDLSVKYIKNQNPNINIVATEFYNPYYEVQIATFDLGGFVDEATVKMNKILNNRSNNESDYKVAKIYKAFNTTNPRLTNVDVDISIYDLKIEMDPHPNVAGHEMIATKVMDAVSTIKENKKKIEELSISSISDQTYTGNEIKPKVTIKDGSNTLTENVDYTLIYIDNTKVGEAKIKITGIGNYEGNVIKTFNIKEQQVTVKTIEDLSVSNIGNQVFTGIAIKPTVNIKDGSYQLLDKKDYTVSYKNNTNVGMAMIIIKGIGNYNGEKSVTFNIEPMNIGGTSILDIDNQEYSGSEIKPNVTVYNGSIKLVENQDYNISYNNNTNVGTATVTITGRNNYTGTIEKQFQIVESVVENKKDINEVQCSLIEDKIYTGKLITPEVVLVDGEKVLIKNVDYILNYDNNLEIGTGKVTITGIGDYTGKSEKTFNIVKKDINHTYIEDIVEQDYTGNEIRPTAILTNDYEQLEEGKDYSLEYKENVDEGTAEIIVKGKNNFDNTLIKSYNIINKNKPQEKDEEEENHDDGGYDYGDSRFDINEKDPTVSNRILPQTGQTIAVVITISLFTFMAIALKIWLNRNINI